MPDQHPIPMLHSVGPDALRAAVLLEKLASNPRTAMPLAKLMGKWLAGYEQPIAVFTRRCLTSERLDAEYLLGLEWAQDAGFPTDESEDPIPGVCRGMVALLGSGPEDKEVLEGSGFRFYPEARTVVGLAHTVELRDRAELIAEVANALEALERTGGQEEVAHA